MGASKPPYTKWEWKYLGLYLSGPNMLQDPDGNWWVASSVYIPPEGPRTILRLDVATGKLTEVLRLSSKGDTSYSGMVWHNKELWLSYYSSHEKKTSIYIARIRVK